MGRARPIKIVQTDFKEMTLLLLVMLLLVYIHTGQAWKICLATAMGIEPTTFGILAQCSAHYWPTRSGRFELVCDISEPSLVLSISMTM